MLAAVAIVAILAAMLVANYDRIVGAAQQAICAGNMRSIHAALNLYLQDNKDVWPQAPDLSEEKPWQSFWLQTLAPFGITEKTWQCPAIRALARRDGERGAQIHYAPSSFDDTPGIARRWPTQPWLIERADVHGQGPLICFPDGSIESLRKVLYRQGLLP